MEATEEEEATEEGAMEETAMEEAVMEEAVMEEAVIIKVPTSKAITNTEIETTGIVMMLEKMPETAVLVWVQHVAPAACYKCVFTDDFSSLLYQTVFWLITISHKF